MSKEANELRLALWAKAAIAQAQDAQDLAFSICLEVKSVLAVLSDAVDKANRLSTNSDIASALETCAALIETANEIQSKEA